MGDNTPKTLFQSAGNYQDFRVWLTNNKLQALGAWERRLGHTSWYTVLCASGDCCQLIIATLPHRDSQWTRAGGAWLTAVAGSFGVQMLYNTPMTLKVFQTRIYAQAFTLAALCGAAAITISDDEAKDKVQSTANVTAVWTMHAFG